MKLQFKKQDHQVAAVNAVVNCFDGNEKSDSNEQRMNLTEEALMKNIKKVQREHGLPVSTALNEFPGVQPNYEPGAEINLDIEMETGTGKTYCYINTILEMNKRYGWSKFIIVVPSIAIREGVYKTFQITREHFAESYNRKNTSFFVYNSEDLSRVKDFCEDNKGKSINVMIINIQAFNSKSTANRRIHEELDQFESRSPIDCIKAVRPILILDEPQKMGGDATLGALPSFNPLMILRYSATHRVNHHKIYRLDAVDAYENKLVKKIAVKGITSLGLDGTGPYLWLKEIKISKTVAPVARVEMQIRRQVGIKREVRQLKVGQDLFNVSRELEQYNGFKVKDIIEGGVNDKGRIEFTNGIDLCSGETINDSSERYIRHWQIRETIRAHLDREKLLFTKNIKVLSLFFIDKVAKYRDHGGVSGKGEYARIFEEEYNALRKKYLKDKKIDGGYRKYLSDIEVSETHKGYFSKDKKDPTEHDKDAYNLILKDKERLLSLKEDKTRFIFSHSALREGWDNPNVFVICTLKQSDNTISRRQEVGRGLRLCVDGGGNRVDTEDPDINLLTVVASESYAEFADNLQKEIVEGLPLVQPCEFNVDFFLKKKVKNSDGSVGNVKLGLARAFQSLLIINGYIGQEDYLITENYRTAKDTGTLADLPEEWAEYKDQMFGLIDDCLDSQKKVTPPINLEKLKTNKIKEGNLRKFEPLWGKINQRAFCRINFEQEDLITEAVDSINTKLDVTSPQLIATTWKQDEKFTREKLREGRGFNKVAETESAASNMPISSVRYDLIGKIAENVQLMRKTVEAILGRIHKDKFAQFKVNPEDFIEKSSQFIKEAHLMAIKKGVFYDKRDDKYEIEIFRAFRHQIEMGADNVVDTPQRHVYEHCITDSHVEKEFVSALDRNDNIVVYAKLPPSFLVPTPFGDYNPDWAIMLNKENVTHIYFVAETKGSTSPMDLRGAEQGKIDCGKKFFECLNKWNKLKGRDTVKYKPVKSYKELINAAELLSAGATQ